MLSQSVRVIRRFVAQSAADMVDSNGPVLATQSFDQATPVKRPGWIPVHHQHRIAQLPHRRNSSRRRPMQTVSAEWIERAPIGMLTIRAWPRGAGVLLQIRDHAVNNFFQKTPDPLRIVWEEESR